MCITHAPDIGKTNVMPKSFLCQNATFQAKKRTKKN